MTSFFSAEGGPIWIKFRRLAQNDMWTAVIWSKSKPYVEFQYGGRLGEFSGMSSRSRLPHCKVLPPGEFNVGSDTLVLGRPEIQRRGPMPSKAEFHEQRQRLERFEEDSYGENPTERTYFDHYHDKPADVNHQRSSGRRDGERWFNEHALNIHHSANDIREPYRLHSSSEISIVLLLKVVTW